MIIEIISKKHGVKLLEIDDDDYNLIKDYKLVISKESKENRPDLFYVVGWIPPRIKGKALVRIHRLIMGAYPGQFVDHINHNTLDNRRSNLRIATHSDNMRNTRKRHSGSSKFKGVDFIKNKWRARIYINGRSIALGSYLMENDAALAYNAALDKYNVLSPKNNVKNV